TLPPLPVAEPGRAKLAYALIAPLGGFVLYGAAHQYFVAPEGGWSAAFAGESFLPFTALMLVSSAACAGVCYALARRHAFSRARRAGWALAGLPVGAGGVRV